MTCALEIRAGNQQFVAFDIRNTEAELVFLSGAFTHGSNGEERWRWVGAEIAETALFAPGSARGADRSVLRGQPIQSNEIAATVSFDGARTDQIDFGVRNPRRPTSNGSTLEPTEASVTWNTTDAPTVEDRSHRPGENIKRLFGVWLETSTGGPAAYVSCMSWHNDFDPDCESGHESTAMLDDGPVHHGQSRTYVCPVCGREVLASNVPGETEPSTRQLRAGTTTDAAPTTVERRGTGSEV